MPPSERSRSNPFVGRWDRKTALRFVFTGWIWLWPFFGCKLWVLFVDGLEDRVAHFVEHSAKGAPEYPGLDRIVLCLDKKTDPMEFPGNKVQVA